MKMLKHALDLAQRGFFVFPLAINAKTPVELGVYAEVATQNADVLRAHWFDVFLDEVTDFNPGICTQKWRNPEGELKALVVVDVDRKHEGIDGLATIEEHLEAGRDFPKTFTQQTPTGGLHLFYWSDRAVTQGAKVLGPGLDIRSHGGLIVGAGSEINGKSYTILHDFPLAQCPEWIIQKRKKTKEAKEIVKGDFEFDPRRIEQYIKNVAPTAEIGDLKITAYRVGGVIKDLGADEVQCLEWMTKWRDLKAPDLQDDTLRFQVECVYRYGKRPLGVELPENDFDDVDAEEVDREDDPQLKYNREYAFVLEGGNAVILHETQDPFGKFYLERIKLNAFHQRFAMDTVLVSDNRQVSTTKLWIKHPKRRTYERVVFQPGQETPPMFYNLWKGFNWQPSRKSGKVARQAVEAFEEHVLENICGSNNGYFNWVMSYFAHLVQKPYEKPLVALVLRGGKGVGKDTPINIIGGLVDRHYIMASDSRYFVGNFNAHLEQCLLIALNEAFWSGDKKAEGVLKHLITGDRHLIERKGHEVTVAKNYTRVVIIGNEQWLVPATMDERRFAVFNVGDKRKQDNKFFRDMREGMEQGGYSLLLQHLLDYKIQVDINVAPKTDALNDQISSSLPALEQWWLNRLHEGDLFSRMSFEGWPERARADDLRSDFTGWCRELGIRGRLPDSRVFGRTLHTFGLDRIRCRDEGSRAYYYVVPSLSKCRLNWERLIGYKIRWETIDELQEVGL